MALTFETNNPQGLLSDIKKAIDSESIQTWNYDSDGDFTHTPDQWKHKAWMRPLVLNGKLQFNFVGNNEIKTTKLLYAVYHGRFTEMVLNHFDDKFITVHATAMPTKTDKITQGV